MSKYNGWRPVRFDDVVPEMKKNNWAVLIWTCVYLLNLGLILLVQSLSYSLPSEVVDQDMNYAHLEAAVESEVFPGWTILDFMPSSWGDYLLMEDEAGTQKLVRLQENLVLRRYKVAVEATVPQGQDVAVNMDTYLEKATIRVTDGRIDWSASATECTAMGMMMQRGSSKTMGVYLFIAVILLLIEYGIYCQIQKLRE